MRWLALIGGVGWLATIVVTALLSDLDTASAVLFGLLGLLVIAGLALLLIVDQHLRTINRRLAKMDAVLAPTAPKEPKPVRISELDIDRLAELTSTTTKHSFRQTEALQNLYAVIDIDHALPASRGWPASPDLLLFLVDLVDRHRPTVVVECGSGLSTLCLALAMRRFGVDGKVIALEHLPKYAAQTEELLARHGVADIAEVRVAPLATVELADVTVGWYARETWADLGAVDLLFVDGPPSKLSPHSRYPALPLFAERLKPGAHIVLDDYQRTEERDVVKRWRTEYGDRLTLAKIPLEKGAALLTFE